MEKRAISFETEVEMKRVIAFTIERALKHIGLPIDEIENLTYSISVIAEEIFTSYCECENII